VAKAIVCDIDEKFLKCGTRWSDRLVFSQYFTPLTVSFAESRTSILTKYQKDWLGSYLSRSGMNLLELMREQPLRDVVEKNAVKSPKSSGYADPPRPAGSESDKNVDLHEKASDVLRRGDDVRRDATELKALIGALARGDERNPLLGLVEAKIETLVLNGSAVSSLGSAMTATTRMLVVKPDDGSGTTGNGGGTSSNLPTVTEAADALAAALQSPIGYLFLDRTRIRPTGFAVGEHVFALSLAPGEEVTLEQKTYSKKTITYEEESQREQEEDLEFSSSLTTEMQEGVQRQRNLSTSQGFTAGGSLGGNIYGIDINASASTSNNITEANNETLSRSVKTTSTASAKTASKYRTQHKVDFKISTEVGFESTSRRVVRNPNRFTPIQLHYFKVLRTIELTQERYGVRLCWAVCVKGPGFSFAERIRKGRVDIVKAAESAVTLPPAPAEPAKAGRPPLFATSAPPVEANKWGWTCDMSANYDVSINAPNGYVWDGDAQRVKDSVMITSVNRASDSFGFHVVGEPWVEGTTVKVKVHVGAGSKWGGCGSLFITAGANFIADPNAQDADYQKRYAEWVTAMADWKTKVAGLTADARAATVKRADEWEAAMSAGFNPMMELMNAVVQQHFPPVVRDQCWEIEYWRTLFDWENAAFVLYPGWWSDLPAIDATKATTDFVNASWATVYIPIAIKSEKPALRWIYGHSIGASLGQAVEAALDNVVKDITAYRTKSFGDVAETQINPGADCSDLKDQTLCLARWNEVVPTDGTHLEVVQSMTTAADALSDAENADAAMLRAAVIDSHKQDAQVKKTAVTQMTGAATIDVRVGTDGTPTT